MLEVVEAWLPLISCFLYEESFADIDCFLAFETVLLNVSCILGHAWSVVAVPLYASVMANIIVSASRAVNTLESYLSFIF